MPREAATSRPFWTSPISRPVRRWAVVRNGSSRFWATIAAPSTTTRRRRATGLLLPRRSRGPLLEHGRGELAREGLFRFPVAAKRQVARWIAGEGAPAAVDDHHQRCPQWRAQVGGGFDQRIRVSALTGGRPEAAACKVGVVERAGALAVHERAAAASRPAIARTQGIVGLRRSDSLLTIELGGEQPSKSTSRQATSPTKKPGAPPGAAAGRLAQPSAESGAACPDLARKRSWGRVTAECGRPGAWRGQRRGIVKRASSSLHATSIVPRLPLPCASDFSGVVFARTWICCTGFVARFGGTALAFIVRRGGKNHVLDPLHHRCNRRHHRRAEGSWLLY